jgi:murein DD-endopeptidase MepM/ murein hydrolase activator NlpD
LILFFLILIDSILFSLNPKFMAPKHIKDMGTRIYKEGNYPNTVKFLLRTLNSYPEDEQLLLYLAYSYLNLGLYTKSEKSYIDILKLNPKNFYAISGLSSLYQNRIQDSISRNNYNLGFLYVKKAEYYIPEMSIFYTKDAELNMHIGNYEEAVTQWKSSWEKDPLDMDKKLTSDIWMLDKMFECCKYLNNDQWIDTKKYITGLQKKYQDNEELMILAADIYFYCNEETVKRNELRMKAYKKYVEKNGAHPPVEVYFPLKGKWYVTSGNFESLFDTHNGYNGYCFDLVKIDEKGSRFASGSGSKNTDFLSYNENIYACQDGIVESVSDSVEDNIVGKVNFISTNQVKIRHSLNNDIYYSVYLHLKKGTIPVKAGDNVVKGQFIGKVGNSGLSYAPHLHFGLFDQKRVSIPIIFLTESKDINNPENVIINQIINLKRNDTVSNQ